MKNGLFQCKDCKYYNQYKCLCPVPVWVEVCEIRHDVYGKVDPEDTTADDCDLKKINK